uniref:Transmembrane protein n=1 Tax=Eutreptiella gymnastica TaxID=73025 RepID=A0A7S1IRJ6_9EUGL
MSQTLSMSCPSSYYAAAQAAPRTESTTWGRRWAIAGTLGLCMALLLMMTGSPKVPAARQNFAPPTIRQPLYTTGIPGPRSMQGTQRHMFRGGPGPDDIIDVDAEVIDVDGEDSGPARGGKAKQSRPEAERAEARPASPYGPGSAPQPGSFEDLLMREFQANGADDPRLEAAWEEWQKEQMASINWWQVIPFLLLLVGLVLFACNVALFSAGALAVLIGVAAIVGSVRSMLGIKDDDDDLGGPPGLYRGSGYYGGGGRRDIW